MFEPADETAYPVIPAPSMRRRNSSDLEELGMEIRKLEEEVSSDDMEREREREMERNMAQQQQQQQQQQRRTERVVETRRSKVTTRTVSSKRREGA